MGKCSAFRIVTAYEDSAAGVRAREMCERLAEELKPQLEIHSDVWKFELLGHPQLQAYAAADAAEADMVIISARGEADLPAHVNTWIEGWLTQKKPHPVGLVALLDQDEGTPGVPPCLCASLRQVAQRGHMDFFCKMGDWRQQDFEYVIDTIHHRSESRTAVLEEMLHQELRSRFQWIRTDGAPAFRLRTGAWGLKGWSSPVPELLAGVLEPDEGEGVIATAKQRTHRRGRLSPTAGSGESRRPESHLGIPARGIAG